MSADNWGICPRCKQQHGTDRARKIDAAKSRYGKAPIDNYTEELQAAMAMPLKPPETLREDCELGTDAAGKFTASYSCHCEACGFTFTFAHEEDTLDRATTEVWG